MGTIQILDTGMIDTSSTTATMTQAPGDAGVAGALLTLKGAEVTANFNTMITEDSAVCKSHNDIDTSYFDFGKSDRAGVNLPTWTLKVFINRTTEADMITFGRLIFMGKTKGYKKLYSAYDGIFYDVIAYSKYGENESNGISTKTISYIPVSIKSISVSQPSEKGFWCTVNLVETL